MTLINKPKLKPNTVYVRPREGGAGFDIVWLEGKVTRRVYRRNETVAKEYADRLQAKFDRGEEKEAALPFGDTVASMDGSTGTPWLLLLWEGALLAAANPGPGPRGLLEALRVVAASARSARPFIPADLLRADAGGENPDDDAFWLELCRHAKPYLAKRGVSEEDQKLVLGILSGGKAA